MMMISHFHKVPVSLTCVVFTGMGVKERNLRATSWTGLEKE